MDRRPKRRRPLAGPRATWLLAVVLTGCVSIEFKPSVRAVQDLEVKPYPGFLLVTWKNPVSFDKVTVTVMNQEGQDQKLAVDGFSSREGTARAVILRAAVRRLPHVGPGWKVRVTSYVGGDKDWVESPLPIWASVRKSPVTAGPSPLRVAYLVHSQCELKTSRVFQRVTNRALHERFMQVQEVPSVKRLEDLETYREERTSAGKTVRWPLDANALFLVDYRAAEEAAPAVLALRILDLSFGRLLDKDHNDQGRELYNCRPLVVEGYGAVEPLSTEESQQAEAFRQAWQSLLAELTDLPRFKWYREQLAALEEGKDVDRSAFRLFMFRQVPPDRLPFAKGHDRKQYDAAVKKIQAELLFPTYHGRPAGPHDESRPRLSPPPEPSPGATGAKAKTRNGTGL